MEWIPTTPNSIVGKVFILSILLMLGLFALARRRPTVREVCLVVCFLPIAWSSVRMVSWWLFVIAPIATSILADTFPRLRDQPLPEMPTVSAFVFCLVLVMICVMGVPWLEQENPLFRFRNSRRVEHDLEEMVAQLPPEDQGYRVFTRFEWGEYLGWRIAPTGQIFMDARIEIYPDRVWSEYKSISAASRGWNSVLDRYEVDYLLLDVTYHSNLLARVNETEDWERIGQSGDAELYRRKHAARGKGNQAMAR